MEVNGGAVEELSDGNYVCKLCASYLTLGKNEDIKRDNLHIHFNGKRHKFRCQILEKSFAGIGDYSNYLIEFCSVAGNIYQGIFNDINLNNFYCCFCDCVLPHLSKDRRSNIININIHLSSRRHNFNVLQNYAELINFEDECCNADDTIHFESRTPDFYSSITSSFHSNQYLSLEDIFSELPDHFRDHRNVIDFDVRRCKFICIVCKCFIALARNKITMINHILLHIEGRKHLLLYHHKIESNVSGEAEDENLMKVLKMTKSKVIDKNQTYVLRNAVENIICKLCECTLPDIGKNGYLVAIKNFEIHFSGRVHKKNLKHHLQQRVNRIVKDEGENLNEKSDEIILRICNGLSKDLPKSSAIYFMISKSSNLICKLCSCIIVDNLESFSDKELGVQVEKHIQMVKHERNYLQKESVKYYNVVTSNITKTNNKSLLSCENLQSIIKLDSCGQFVCSLCCRVIVKPDDFDMEIAVLSHLKGRKHKKNNNKKHINKLTENVLVDIIDSLPGNFKINKKYLSFIFDYGIVHCNICHYMFTACNNFRLRNNLMIHITSVKHNHLINILRPNSGSDCDDNIDNYDSDSSSNSSKMMKDNSLSLNYGDDLLVKENEDDIKSYGTDRFCDSDFSELLDAGSEIFFHHLFKNYIPSDLQYNKNYLSLKRKGLYCLVCDCTLITPLRFSAVVQVLMNHFCEVEHKKKVKKLKIRDFFVNPALNEKKFTNRNLTHIFKNHIPAAMRDNKEHIKITSNKLFCNICQCSLFETGNSNEKIIRKLKSHFKSKVHNKNNSNLRNVDEKSCGYKLNGTAVTNGIKNQDGPLQFDHVDNSYQIMYQSVDHRKFKTRLSNIFKNNIPASMRCNKEHIKIISSKLYCDICQCDLLCFSNSDKTVVINLKLHFKGQVHNDNTSKLSFVKKMAINNPVVSTSVDKNGHGDFLSNQSSPLKSDLLETGVSNTTKKQNFDNKANMLNSLNVRSNTKIVPNSKHMVDSTPLRSGDTDHKVSDRTEVTRGKFFEKAEESLQDLHSDCIIDGLPSFKNDANIHGKNSLDKSDKYLEDLFRFIPSELKLGKPYIFVESNVLVCDVCDCTLPKSVNPQNSSRNVIEHLKGYFHKSNLKTIKPESLAIKKGIDTDNKNNSVVNNNKHCTTDDRYIEEIFNNFIPFDLKFNRSYLSIESGKLICDICGCIICKSVYPQNSAKNVEEHLRGYFHRNNLKNQRTSSSTTAKILVSYENKTISEVDDNNSCAVGEKFLEELFNNFILPDFKFNRRYVSVKSNSLVCNICRCVLSRAVKPPKIASTVMQHLKGYLHTSNLKTQATEDLISKKSLVTNKNKNNSKVSNKNSCSVDEKYLEELFNNFILPDFKFNRRYISVKSNLIVCNICDYSLPESVNSQNTARILMEHLRCLSHASNLKCFEKEGNGSSKVFQSSTSNTLKGNKTVLENVFEKFVPHEFKFNRPYITIKSDKVHCDLCNFSLFRLVSSQITGHFLVMHFKGDFHRSNLGEETLKLGENFECKIGGKSSVEMKNSGISSVNKSQGNDNVFLEAVSENCGDSSKLRVESVIAHNLSAVDGIVLDCAFQNLIGDYFNFNKQFISLKLNWLCCSLCNYCKIVTISNIFERFFKPLMVAKQVMEHLNGKFHRKNLCRIGYTIYARKQASDDSSTNSSSVDVTDKTSESEESIFFDPDNVTEKSCMLFENDKYSNENLFKIKMERAHTYVSENSPVGDDFCNAVFDYMFPDFENKNMKAVACKSLKGLLDICSVTCSSVTGSTENTDTASNNLCRNSSDIDSIDELKSINSLSIDSNDLSQQSYFQHQSIDEKTCEIDNTTSTVTGNSSCEKSERYLEEVFLKFIDDDLRFNRQYLSVKSNQLGCNICNCSLSLSINPQTTVKNLMSHLRGYRHLTNLERDERNGCNMKNTTVVESWKKNKCYLDYIFDFLIPLELQSDRQYMFVKSCKFFCRLCGCQMSIPVIPEVAADILIEHLTGGFHESNLETETFVRKASQK